MGKRGELTGVGVLLVGGLASPQTKGYSPREEDVGIILAIHNAVNEQGTRTQQASSAKAT